MQTLPRTDLARLDAAMGQLRRMWESPGLRRHFTERLGETIEPAVVRTLRALADGGPEPGVADVAAALRVEASTASRLVDQAVAAGYVSRSTASHDRRRCVLSLTDRGRDVFARASAVRSELIAHLTEGWTSDEIATLAALLERLSDAIDHLEP